MIIWGCCATPPPPVFLCSTPFTPLLPVQSFPTVGISSTITCIHAMFRNPPEYLSVPGKDEEDAGFDDESGMGSGSSGGGAQESPVV
jgi:hypothetical protein